MWSQLTRLLLTATAIFALGDDDDPIEDLEVCLLQTGLVPSRTPVLREVQRSPAGQRARQPECSQVAKLPLYPPGTDPQMWVKSEYMYLVAATDDSQTNPYSWRLVQRRNMRQQWLAVKGGLIFYWQTSDAPDAAWSAIDFRNLSSPAMQKYMKLRQKSCSSGSCWSAYWHIRLWEGYPLMINWSCQEDMVGNEVFWAGGQTASKQLMDYVEELIANQTGGLQNFPVVATNTGPYSTPCPWEGGQSGKV